MLTCLYVFGCVLQFAALGIWRTVVAMIGKFCISATFAIIYLYSVELFPTPVRYPQCCCPAVTFLLTDLLVIVLFFPERRYNLAFFSLVVTLQAQRKPVQFHVETSQNALPTKGASVAGKGAPSNGTALGRHQLLRNRSRNIFFFVVTSNHG